MTPHTFSYYSTAINMRRSSCLCAWISLIRLHECVLVNQDITHEMKSATLSVRSSAHPQCVSRKHTQTPLQAESDFIFPTERKTKRTESYSHPNAFATTLMYTLTHAHIRSLPTTTNATAMKISPCVVGCESALLILWTSSGSRSMSLSTTENSVFIRRVHVFFFASNVKHNAHVLVHEYADMANLKLFIFPFHRFSF